MKYKAILYFMDIPVKEMELENPIEPVKEILVPVIDNKIVFSTKNILPDEVGIDSMLVFTLAYADDKVCRYTFERVELFNQRYGHNKVYEILKELGVLHGNKNKDYAEPDRPLGNFERVGKILDEWGIKFDGKYSAEKVALIYSLKQIDAVGILLGKGEEGKVENRSHRYNDVAVYSVIGRVLNEEKK